MAQRKQVAARVTGATTSTTGGVRNGRSLSGLQKVCKMFGRVVVQGKVHLWDYAREEAVPAAQMKKGSARRAASEKARAEWLRSLAAQTKSEEKST